MGSDAPNPRDAVQQLQHLRGGPKAGQALGWAHWGSGCSSMGAHGTSSVLLRLPTSTLHQPIRAAKIPSLGTSAFQPTPTGTGLCWSNKPTPPCPVPTKHIRAVGPGAGPCTAGSCSPLPCALAAAVSSPGHQQILHRIRNVSAACLLQRSVSGGLTRILNGQKPLGIHRAQELVLYCHV